MLCKNIFDSKPEPTVIHDGIGKCLHSTIFEEKDFDTPIRFFNYTILPPQATFGAHQHGNDNEIYICLSGEGIYIEDGQEFAVKKGSVMVNAPYGTHSIINTGSEDLALLVLEVAN